MPIVEKNRVDSPITATCPQQKTECNRLIICCLLESGQDSTIGLTITSNNPPPTAQTTVASISPANGSGSRSGKTDSRISPAPPNSCAATAITR